MSNPADLERRFRSAVPDPDTDRALEEVLARIGRRRRVTAAVIAVVVAVLVVAGAVGVVQLRDDDAPVFVGEPKADDAGMRARWMVPGVGMRGSFVLSDGRVVVAASDAVFAATGFRSERGEITALERSTGDVRWTAQAGELGEGVFLQGVAGDVLVVGTPQQVIGFDVADGHRRWTIELGAMGLDGYRAVRSAMSEPVTAVGLSTPTEGDGRAPVLLGIDVASGDIAWETGIEVTSDALQATGFQVDDLTFGTPPVEGGDAVFISTSRANLVDLTDGHVRWSVKVGDGVGFGDVPAIIDGDAVHLPAYDGSGVEVRTVARIDGSARWERAGHGATLIGGELWSLTADGSVQRLDRDTGEVLEVLDPSGEPAQQLVDVGGLVGLVGQAGLAVIDRQGAVHLRVSWPGSVADLAVDRGEVLVATDDAVVHAYDIDLNDAASCARPAGDAPVVGSYIVTALPDGFEPDGAVERTSTGDSDAGGETRAVQRFVDGDGRVIEVVDLNGYDPSTMVTSAHEGASSEPITIRRCIETADGPVVFEQRAELSTTKDRIVIGTTEWEYGGFAVIGGRDVTLGEVLAVATGLRRR